MGLLQLTSVAFGVVMFGGALLAALAILRVPRLGSRDAAFLLSVACLVGGVFVASVAVPDWSPVALGVFYVPFLCVGIWMAILASRRGRAVASGSVVCPQPTDDRAPESNRIPMWFLLAWAALAVVPIVVIAAVLLWDAAVVNLLSFGSGL